MNIPVDPLRTARPDEGIFIRTRLSPSPNPNPKQVAQYELTEDQLVRQGRFLYYQEALTASHGAAQRNLVRPGDGR